MVEPMVPPMVGMCPLAKDDHQLAPLGWIHVYTPLQVSGRELRADASNVLHKQGVISLFSL